MDHERRFQSNNTCVLTVCALAPPPLAALSTPTQEKSSQSSAAARPNAETRANNFNMFVLFKQLFVYLMTNGCQSIILSTELRNPNPIFCSQISSDQKMTSLIFNFFYFILAIFTTKRRIYPFQSVFLHQWVLWRPSKTRKWLWLTNIDDCCRICGWFNHICNWIFYATHFVFVMSAKNFRIGCWSKISTTLHKYSVCLYV